VDSPDRTVRVRASSVAALFASAAVLAVALGLVFAARAWRGDLTPASPRLVFDLAVVGALVAHELLHAAGFVAAGARGSDLWFTASLRRGAAYAGCRRPVTARGYRGATLLPGIVLGALPLVFGLAVGSHAIGLFGALLLGAAGGDLHQIWLLRGVPPDHLVAEDPADPHVLVLTVSSISRRPP
jgi:hypothetical protein